MAVAGEEQIDAGWPAERIHDPRDGWDVGRERLSSLCQSSAAAKEGRLREARDVAVGQNSERANLVVDVRYRQPRDVNVCGSLCAALRHDHRDDKSCQSEREQPA